MQFSQRELAARGSRADHLPSLLFPLPPPHPAQIRTGIVKTRFQFNRRSRAGYAVEILTRFYRITITPLCEMLTRSGKGEDIDPLVYIDRAHGTREKEREGGKVI